MRLGWTANKNSITYLQGCENNPREWEYDIRLLDEEADKDKVFYKSRWTKEPVRVIRKDGITKKVVLEQQLVVSYSIKYRDYQRAIQNSQIARAEKMVASGESAAGRKRQNDPKMKNICSQTNLQK